MRGRVRCFRKQEGVTLIEILLVAVIVAASVVGVFIFSQKSSATAAVKQEQRQVEAVARAVENIFSYQSNFQALGMDGGDYLREHTSKSAALSFEKDSSGKYFLASNLTGDPVNIRAARVDFPNGTAGQPNNGFVLTYSNLTAGKCVGLVSATAALATRVDIGPAGRAEDATASHASGLASSAILISSNGSLDGDKSKISSACRAVGSSRPTVYLSFAPSRSVTPASPAPSTPGATCNPINETQIIACPTGQAGSVMQRRAGNCSGPGNSLVYTAWTTTETTCVDEAVAPPSMLATAPVAACSTLTLSQVVACPAGQNGLRIQTRSHDTCNGSYTPWVDLPGNHCTAPVERTCFPSSVHEDVACPDGMSGAQSRTRGLHCPSPTSMPQHLPTDPWTTYSNTCQGTPTCAPVRDTRTIRCDTGYYGDFFAHQERLRACSSANVVGAWSGWVIYEDAGRGQYTSGSCTACPPTVTETDLIWVGRSASCPAGQAGLNTWEAQRVSTRQQYYNCPAGTLVLPGVSYTSWSPYSDTGPTRNHVNTCGACPGPETQSEGQTVACPAGQTGSISQQRTRTRNYSCSGTGSWGSWSAWTAWSNVSNSCVTPAPTCATPDAYYYHYSPDVLAAGVPAYSHWITYGHLEGRPSCWPAPAACVVPAPQSENNVWSDTSRTDACPAGQVGTGINYRRDITDRRTRAASCPISHGTPVWGDWSGWVRINEGAWIETGRNCNVACVSPGPSSTPIIRALANETRNAGCPAGQTGTHMQTRTVTENGTRTTSWSCPGPTSSTADAWGGGLTHGAWTTTSNTCVAAAPLRWQTEETGRYEGGTPSDRTIYEVTSSSLPDSMRSCFSPTPSGPIWTWRGSGWMPGFNGSRAGCECNETREGLEFSWWQDEYFASWTTYRTWCGR